MIQTLCLALSILSATSASAAIFNTIDSVDQLEVIAAKNADQTDRMPAGTVSDPSKDESTSAPIDVKNTVDAEKKN
jgi:hypothetical protein